MAAQGTKQDMGSGSIPKLMLNLAIPAVVAQLINMLYNIVESTSGTSRTRGHRR